VFAEDRPLLEAVASDWNAQVTGTPVEGKVTFSVAEVEGGGFQLGVKLGEGVSGSDLPPWMAAVLPMVTGEFGVAYRVREVDPNAPGTVPPVTSKPGETGAAPSFAEAAPEGEPGMFIPSEGLLAAHAAAVVGQMKGPYEGWLSGLGPAADPAVVGDDAPPKFGEIGPALEGATAAKLRAGKAVLPTQSLEASILLPTTVRAGQAVVQEGEPPATIGEVVAHELALHGTQYSPVARADLTARTLASGNPMRLMGSVPSTLQGAVPRHYEFGASKAVDLYAQAVLEQSLPGPLHSLLLYEWGYVRGR